MLGIDTHVLYAYTVKVSFQLSVELTVQSKSAPLEVLFSIHGTGWNDVSMLKYSTSFEIDQTAVPAKHRYESTSSHTESASDNKFSMNQLREILHYIPKIFSSYQHINYTFNNPIYKKFPMEEFVVFVPAFNISTTLLGNTYMYVIRSIIRYSIYN